MKRTLFLIFCCVMTAACIAQTYSPYYMHIKLPAGTLHYPVTSVTEARLDRDSVPAGDGHHAGQTVTETYDAITVSGVAEEFAAASVSGGRSEVTVAMPGITMQAVATTDNWSEKLQSDIGFYYLLGTGNPYTSDGRVYNPDGSSGMPANGVYYRFMPKHDGVLKIGIWSNKNGRRTYVVEESTMLPVEYQTEGYINGQNDETGRKRLLTDAEIDALHASSGAGDYVIGSGSFFWGWITISVEAGKTYWLFQDTSQIGFQGFAYTYVSDGTSGEENPKEQMLSLMLQEGNVRIPAGDTLNIWFDRSSHAPQTVADALLADTIAAIPAEYAGRAARRGRVTGVTYTTTSYVDNSKITKTAYVYLPWEYEYYPGRRYNILYLMHGMGDDATTYIYGNTKELRMVIDHLIEDHIIEPLIVVTPTFYAPDAGNADINKAAAAFPEELVNDLMPVVETKFRTYAESADHEGFRASRSHRAFAGFSMGSVVTWNVFCKALHYISDFVPMSGGMTMTTGGGAVAERLAETVANFGVGKDGFYINAMSGTGDYAAAGLAGQIRQMSAVAPFVLDRNKDKGNLYYREWDEGKHDYKGCITYVYNALLNMFR
ncbi:MAG: alpha/beta hydrolase-fold protein [Prevotella sp.]|nr:alpha/beta hydrolase-fold protein [Prevotella sp.]